MWRGSGICATCVSSNFMVDWRRAVSNFLPRGMLNVGGARAVKTCFCGSHSQGG